MKSSSISLFFEDETVVSDEQTGEKTKKSVPYLINLVDSPGHISAPTCLLPFLHSDSVTNR